MKLNNILSKTITVASIITNLVNALPTTNFFSRETTCLAATNGCPHLDFGHHAEVTNTLRYYMSLDCVTPVADNTYEITIHVTGEEQIDLKYLYSLKIIGVDGPEGTVQLYGYNEDTYLIDNPTDYKATFQVYGNPSKDDDCEIWMPNFEIQYEYLQGNTSQYNQTWEWGATAFDLSTGCHSYDNNNISQTDFPGFYRRSPKCEDVKVTTTISTETTTTTTTEETSTTSEETSTTTGETSTITEETSTITEETSTTTEETSTITEETSTITEETSTITEETSTSTEETATTTTDTSSTVTSSTSSFPGSVLDSSRVESSTATDISSAVASSTSSFPGSVLDSSRIESSPVPSTESGSVLSPADSTGVISSSITATSVDLSSDSSSIISSASPTSNTKASFSHTISTISSTAESTSVIHNPSSLKEVTFSSTAYSSLLTSYPSPSDTTQSDRNVVHYFYSK
ncbi:hypothetical protein KAFR_0B05500 [Kazachstania africana CBS 2517]|uniref:Flo11 domain-containing protein n=1 Tax=Kazachstania africana (strain ATCC 22294 / BCRC 22015 / CBS 2517 / CECT 1963 / NBRC 1671 / NRRL Y-8276) TaxID=1071382 RepID=H2AR45_KAZAF|nr:hypothetical protein KAFR_0B05500 [Kazachstania africana CBS 2517]CCF56845.1 hypothetical protein KAFR_0B05500 [Kazachstania africana CBS 2517]